MQEAPGDLAYLPDFEWTHQRTTQFQFLPHDRILGNLRLLDERGQKFRVITEDSRICGGGRQLSAWLLGKNRASGQRENQHNLAAYLHANT